VHLSDNEMYLSFLGTDGSILGWKEDFNMSFMESIPSQEEAKNYLNKVASESTDNLRVGGHSKGGNLAVYASAFCNDDIKPRILEIYNNDGPGFFDSILDTNEYQKSLTLSRFKAWFGLIICEFLFLAYKASKSESDGESDSEYDINPVIQEIVEIFNQKNSTDKNAIPKGKTNDNIGSKIAKSYNSKINENKNIEKSKTNNNNSKIEKEKEKEKEFIKTRKRKETVLLHVVPENPQIPQEKSIISDVISKLKNNMPASINKIQSEKEKESMTKLEILDDAFNFNENDFKKRRYDRDNVEKSGKKFFKLRYLKNKL